MKVTQTRDALQNVYLFFYIYFNKYKYIQKNIPYIDLLNNFEKSQKK